VIIQAGGSPSGLELAARTADVVFSVVQELASAKVAYADLKNRMVKYGPCGAGAACGAARGHADDRRDTDNFPKRRANLSLLQSLSFRRPNALVLVSAGSA